MKQERKRYHWLVVRVDTETSVLQRNWIRPRLAQGLSQL
jgi:hypothetical protein